MKSFFSYSPLIMIGSLLFLTIVLLCGSVAHASHHHGLHHPPSESFYQKFESTFVKVITPDSFDLEVMRAAHSSPVLLAIGSSWSSPCIEFQAPFIEAASILASEGSAAKFLFLDADQHRAFCKRFRVRQFPTLVIFGKFPEGKSHPRVVGEMELVEVEGAKEKRLIWGTEVDRVHLLSAESIVAHMQEEERKELDDILSRKQREEEAKARVDALGASPQPSPGTISNEELDKHFEQIEALRRAPVHSPEMEARAHAHREALSRKNEEREKRRTLGTLTDEDLYHIKQEDEMRRARQLHDEHLQNIMLEHERAMADVRRRLMEEQLEENRQRTMDRVRQETEQRIKNDLLTRQVIQ